MMVFKELIVNSFYFERMWWSWKDWFWTVSTLGGCGGLQRTDFEQFLLWEGMMLLKELILNSFYFGTVWWSSKNWFWTVSTLGQCGGRCGGVVVMKETDFEQFLLWEDVVVMKELILNSFYFGTVWWSSKNWFWTVSTLGQCGGRCGGVVVMKELILNSFYFGKVWWSWKNWFWTVSTLGRYDGLERTDFEQFPLWEGMMVLKEQILNSFYFGTVWWSWKNWLWTVSTLGQCGDRCGGMVVLKKTDFEQCLLWEGCAGHKRTDFEQFLLWDSVVVLKELILNSFYFGTVWW